MLKTFEGMSGVTHVTRTDGKSVTENLEDAFEFTRNEGKLTRNFTVKEEAVIKYNDMAFIEPCNSIIFRAGKSPVWNRNEHALPMAYRLHSTAPKQAGVAFNMNTLPTMSTASDFDVRRNKPDFNIWFEKRVAQAVKAADALDVHKSLYGYDDRDIEALDPDMYAGDVMRVIDMLMSPPVPKNQGFDPSDYGYNFMGDDPITSHATENTDYTEEVDQYAAELRVLNEPYFLGGVPRSSFYAINGEAVHVFDDVIREAFVDEKVFKALAKDKRFVIRRTTDDGELGDVLDSTVAPTSGVSLWLAEDDTLLIRGVSQVDEAFVEKLKEEARIMGGDADLKQSDLLAGSVKVTDAMVKYLGHLTPKEYKELASGRLAEMIAKAYSEFEEK